MGFALIALLLIFFSLSREIQAPLTKQPPIQPPRAPFPSYISGVGVVEASSENIYIRSSSNRIVEKIFVKVGSSVKKGEPLLQLENRDLLADLVVQEAAYQAAMAKFQKLKDLPRAEDLTLAQAELAAAKAELDLAKSQNEMVQNLPDPRSLSQEQKNQRLFSYQQAEAKWQQAQAHLDKVKGGASKTRISRLLNSKWRKLKLM